MAIKSMSATIHHLPSGLTVLLDPIIDCHTVAIGAFVRVGARYEKISGLAHFLEHMLFKGTKTRSCYTITQEIEQCGGSINAFTGREETAYHVRMMADDAKIGIDILADMLSFPLFNHDDLHSERDVVLQEILQAEDNPEDVLFDGLQKVVFADNHLGEPILGDKKSLQTITADDLRHFMRDYYSADNLILSVAGKFDEAAILEFATHYFSHVPQKKQGQNFKKATHHHGNQHIKRPIEQFHLCLALQGPTANDDDFYHAAAFSEIFGETMSSRLFQTIREKLGLAYAVQSFMQPYHDTGLFGIYAATDPSKAQQLYHALRDELANTKNTLTAEEVLMAQKQLLARAYINYENIDQRMQYNAKSYHIYHKIHSIDDVTQKISAIDLNALNQFAEKLRNAKESWVSVGAADEFIFH
ncbi:MAG: insulinase family protein [Alphaproteobacteria bacterium]|nr:insulinase family protein [Alphaproteobacteria bacterium]